MLPGKRVAQSFGDAPAPYCSPEKRSSWSHTRTQFIYTDPIQSFPENPKSSAFPWIQNFSCKHTGPSIQATSLDLLKFIANAKPATTANPHFIRSQRLSMSTYRTVNCWLGTNATSTPNIPSQNDPSSKSELLLSRTTLVW